MMTMLEEAIIYATVMHQGKKRKLQNRAFILHPMEVAQVLSTMTDDEEVITAGILHDIVEDTDGTLAEIESRFGKRVAFLVSSESEKEYPELDPAASWKLSAAEPSAQPLYQPCNPGSQPQHYRKQHEQLRSRKRS